MTIILSIENKQQLKEQDFQLLLDKLPMAMQIPIKKKDAGKIGKLHSLDACWLLEE